MTKDTNTVKAVIRDGKLFRSVVPEFLKPNGKSNGTLRYEVVPIIVSGASSNPKGLGWIGKGLGASANTYLLKVYGAQWPSKGITKNAITDCRNFNSMREAKDFVTKFLAGN
tara:strand:- start:45 stop:380 length:336 start_codon:yes stop_codon:yes gene_type:complete